jgi:hypothetical protein
MHTAVMPLAAHGGQARLETSELLALLGCQRERPFFCLLSRRRVRQSDWLVPWRVGRGSLKMRATPATAISYGRRLLHSEMN